jgi:hypothetical protein
MSVVVHGDVLSPTPFPRENPGGVLERHILDTTRHLDLSLVSKAAGKTTMVIETPSS